jgi:hypothetical protein|tara:strand:+ start:110 stop:280 length:171 start_codon:yes stop_codon:yes gene_type:complete
MNIINMPIRLVSKEYDRLVVKYHLQSDGVIWNIEKIWLEYPDERVAFETKLRLGVK